MKQKAWNPGVGSMSASQWLVRKIELVGFTPNADFAKHISFHPVECWLDDEGCLVIASPAVNAADLLDAAQNLIEKLESEINDVLAQQRLLNLIKKESPPQERTDDVEY